jgi:hypothetical protein
MPLSGREGEETEKQVALLKEGEMFGEFSFFTG